jgi:superfamily II DNA or RNA helicase
VPKTTPTAPDKGKLLGGTAAAGDAVIAEGTSEVAEGAVKQGLFGGMVLGRPLWPHQDRALAAFELDRRRHKTATYIVVPPGGGKTLIGLEAARRLGRPTVVLCPNTAIQAQWIAQWHAAFAPPAVTATASRELPTVLTVLTYQAVCSLEPGGARPPGDELLDLLHPAGLALVERLQAGGPWTLVLDECHHLLELWGRLLTTLLSRLNDPHVIGLTATPPQLMTAEQAALHTALFGQVDLEISAPALVRDGRLAPYQELAYITRPTAAEAEYIHGEAVRFAELRTDLLDPQFATVPFLAWLQTRVVERPGHDGGQVSWARFEKDEPALANAAVRLHTAGLLPLPDGARVREQHRHAPSADDWVALIGDYSRRCLLASGDPRDDQAYEAIRRALPSVGYRLTRAGARASDSPVDRVLARSESKARAVIEILRAESAELGARLRALVLCDFTEASGQLPARLTGVLPAEAGGARLALETLLSDEATAGLDPVLMTGSQVACGAGTAGPLAAWLRDAGLPATAGTGPVTDITGTAGWEPRRYVPLITRFFTEGGSRCLIGTRALLGEGWDAPAVNVVVDLTAATTPTSVVQARGRALRLDAGWPGKVADNWGVACVTEDHPKGTADYDRLVRKHDHYFALSAAGDIVSGIAHVDPALSPYAPPPLAGADALNAAMLDRSAQRDAVRGRWAVGTPYQDEPVATVTVATRRSLGLAGRAALPLASHRRRRGPIVAGLALGTVAVLAGAVAGPLAAAAVLAAAVVALLAAVAVVAGRRGARAARVPASGCLADLAMATADALHTAGLASRGAGAVLIEALPDGSYRARLQEVPAREAETFSAALEEVLSPLAQPRYVVPRLVVDPPDGLAGGFVLAVRGLVTGHPAGSVVYHAVPGVLGARKQLAAAFETAWHARVSPGPMLYTGSPEGAGILAEQRGDDPFAVTTQIRTLWR